MKGTDFSAVLLVLAALALTSVGAVESHKIYISKIQDQMSQLDLLRQFKSQASEMPAVYAQWEATFKPTSQIKDVINLFEIIGFTRYGLVVDQDGLSVEGIPKTDATGLTRICLRSNDARLGGIGADISGTTGVVVQAETLDKLIAGIQSMVQRRDIEVDSMTVEIDQATRTPRALLGKFCTLVRD